MGRSSVRRNGRPSLAVYGEDPPRIMVYEDQAVGEKLARHLRDRLGVGTAVCWDPDAKPLCREMREVVVHIVDIRLYGINQGLEIIRWLDRLRGGGEPLLVIAMSAFKEERANALRSGANLFLDKDDYEATLGALVEAYKGHTGGNGRKGGPEDAPQPVRPFAVYEGEVLSTGGDQAAVLLNIDGEKSEWDFAIGQLEAAGAAYSGAHIRCVFEQEGSEARMRVEALSIETDERDDSWKEEYRDVVRRLRRHG